MKILVADDDPVNRRYLRALLSHEGHTVIECEDGLAALSWLQKEPCDAVISDVLMPQMDGYRLCYEIRKKKAFRDIPVILYTATYLSAADEKAAMAMGADKFVRKPAQPEQILGALNQAVENSRAQHARRPKQPGNLSALREYSEVLVRKLEETNVELSVANATLAENERRLRAIIESEPECVKILARDGTLLEMNPAGLRMIEADSALQIIGKKIDELIVPEHRHAFQELTGAAFRGQSGTLEFEILGFKGTRRWFDTHTAPLRNSNSEIVAALGITRDITEQKHTAALLKGQMRVLEMIARGAPLRATLDALLRVVEEQANDMLCSILLLDRGRHLKHCAAPRLPEGYTQAIDGAAIGPCAGSCGTAVYRRETVIVEDIASDPLWEEWRQLASAHGLRACWSTPIFDSHKQVLGSFAMYFQTPRRPTEDQLKLIGVATHIAAIAIAKQREEDALRESEARFREMADSSPAMIWITRADGSCIYLNKQWQDFTGQTDETGLGLGWLDALHPEDRERAGREFANANSRHASFRMEYRLRRREGDYRWVIDSAQPRLSEHGEFFGYIGSVIDISERKQAEDERQRSLDRVRALHEINLAITSTMNRQSQLDMLLEKIETVFAYPIVSSVRLFRPQTGRLESLAQRGVNLGEWLSREPGRTLHRALQVVESRSPVIVADIRRDARANGRPMPSSFGLVSYAGVPLIARDRVLGVLGVYTKVFHEFTDEEIEFLTELAGQAAMAIQNAQLYEQTESHLKRIEALREIEKAITSTLDLDSVLHLLLEKIDDLLPFSAATTIRLYDRHAGRFENTACRNINEKEWKARIGQGTRSRSGQVLTTKRPVIVANMQDEPGVSAARFYREYGFVSYLGVPLIVKDDVLGILGFYTREAHDFAQEEIDLLLTVAGQAAIAINNAQLYDDIALAKRELENTNRSLERSLRQLDSLHTTLAPLSPGATNQDIMNAIIGRLIESSGADAALIRLWDADSKNYFIVSHHGYPEAFLKRVEIMPLGGAIDWVIQHGEPILARDIATEDRFLSKTQLSYGFRSSAMLPLNAQDDIRGVMQLSSNRLGYFDEEHREHLVAIARQVSIALENRRLFNDLKQSRDDLEKANAALTESNRMLTALHAVASASSRSLNLDQILNAAIQKITGIFNFDATLIHLHDKNEDAFVLRASFADDPELFSSTLSFKMGDSVVGAVAQSGEKMIFTDALSDPRYSELSRTGTMTKHGCRFLAVFPIKGKMVSLGTIDCINTRSRSLATTEIQLLEAISDQLAVAIENSWLYEDVRSKVDELQLKTIELERAHKVKDEFLGVISHELRTPINVIMGYTSLFKDGVLGAINPPQDNAIAKIARETRELLEMINTLLFATTLETEAIEIDAQEFSVESLLAELRANYAVTAPRQVIMEWRYSADLPSLNTDRRKLKQVLDNLIGNALKFTERGTVTVAARLAESKEQGATSIALGPRSSVLEITVMDTGIGMPSAKLPRIFDKFYQVDSSGTRRFGGVGLGLYIAKKFTELLGGNLAVASAEGVGSTFTLTLPTKPVGG